MASNTENLNLLMKNPSTDGADTFNVQTMLNENWQKIDNNAGTVAQTLANILKPTTPPIIGLPPSTTPDGMFQALGNTGELHVWRKTVTLSEGKPAVQAGYTLGSTTSIDIFKNARPTQSFKCYWNVADSVSVDNDGNVALVSPVEKSLYYNQGDTIASLFRGKFAQYSRTESGGLLNDKNIYWIPQDASIGFLNDSGVYRVYLSAQLVSGHPYTPAIPAGTTTTYPVSTNPNAYQEGSNAKPAGYTLGEVVAGDFILGHANAEIGHIFYKASSPTVSDDGTIEVDKSHSILIFHTEKWTASTLQAAIRGQFLQRGNYMDVSSSYVPAGTIYIPNDAVVTQSNYTYTVSKYQPVTGYAAIPAGTTIEYLGKLGDKARVQVVSYVGTGTYGRDHPNSLTFDFVPKMLFVVSHYTIDWPYFMFATEKASYAHYSGESYRLTFTLWNKTVKWYYDNADGQLNLSGRNYDAVAIG